MIRFEKRDITTVERGIIAHGVNCQKAMGSGVAGAIKAKWPQVYEKFMKTSPDLGKIDLIDIDDDLIIVNCYTQMFYGKDGQRYANLPAIKVCLHDLMGVGIVMGLPIYIPKIGCGLGGLKWDEEVYPVLKTVHDFLDFQGTITVCDL